MGGSILGNRVVRKEDPKFLTTGGKYVDDLFDEPLLAGALHVTYVRSTVAHGQIVSIDTSTAKDLDGVVAVFTAESLGLELMPAGLNKSAKRALLARDKVRYVGEPLAAIVATTRAAGEDAAETVVVDYKVLPAVVDVREAAASTVHLFEEVGSNIVFDSMNLGAPDNSGPEFFDGCEVVVRETIVNQRVAPCPMEVRGSAVAWVDGRLHQWLSTQHAQGAHSSLCRTFGYEPANVRVIAPDVGGGFGAKIGLYGEELLLSVMSQQLGRPLIWRESRSESMVALGHGRAQVQEIAIGGSRDGRVHAYQLKVLQDCGGWVDSAAFLAPFMTRPMSQGVYDIDRIECRTLSIVTNTTPVVPYRGAGRPEATAAIERAMDLFAAEIGMDPVDVRSKNLIQPFNEPYQTKMGQTYDVGNYIESLNRVTAAAKYSELRAEQAKRRAAGDTVQLGIGVSVYVEITGGGGTGDTAKIEVLENGRAKVYTGTSPHGQGHDTAWSMLASDQTGIPMDRIEVIHGDTDLVPKGGGTFGSRSLQQGGAAVHVAAVELVDIARGLAATLLEANEDDIVLDKENGAFHVAGSPSVNKTWADLAVAKQSEGGLVHAIDFRVDGATFPFGAHVAVVEVDTETGKVRHIAHTTCDDAGTVLNPLLRDGQIHGGVAQGSAQALLEEVLYDADGNPTTSNLADYAMISAAEVPSVNTVMMETPTFMNPLGAKGIGESGSIGATPAVQSAVCDALLHLGVRHVDMPTTPERVWRSINNAKSGVGQ